MEHRIAHCTGPALLPWQLEGVTKALCGGAHEGKRGEGDDCMQYRLVMPSRGYALKTRPPGIASQAPVLRTRGGGMPSHARVIESRGRVMKAQGLVMNER